MTSADTLRAILGSNIAGQPKGVYSICSSHPAVLAAAFRQAKRDGSVTLIESTSNQVDQNGGYTGMRPRDFVAYVRGIAEAEGFPVERMVLGGDHLGPNAWSELPAQPMTAALTTCIQAPYFISAANSLSASPR